MADLFDKGPRPKRPPRKRGPWTQQQHCRQCRHCHGDKEGGLCTRHDLCLEWDNGTVRLAKDDQAIICFGDDWQYAPCGNGREAT